MELSSESLNQSAAIDINPIKEGSKKLSYMDKQKQLHANAYAPWTKDDDNRLKQLYAERKSTAELMEIFGRNRGAIKSRLKKLGSIV